MRPSNRAALAALLCAACAGGGALSSEGVDPAGSDGPGAFVSGDPGDPGGAGGLGSGDPAAPTGGASAGAGGGLPSLNGGEAPGPGPVVPAEDHPEFAPAPAALHRLTRSQYANAVRALLGDAAPVPTDLEADTPLHGFSTVGAAELTISPRAAEQFEVAAQALADWAVADGPTRDALVGCDPAAVECLRGFFERTGRRAWRRPLEAAEIDALVGVAQTVAGELRDPWRGLAFGLSALLQSPDFLFRVERGEPDPAVPAPEGGQRRRYTSLEMASRLAFFLWDAPPDDALLDAGLRGELATAEGVRAAATRMLADPRAERGLSRFFEEAINLDRLAGLTKDPATFPQMSATLGASMRGEIEALFRDVVFTRDADFGEVLTSRRIFVNGELASLYGLPGPVDPAAFEPVDLPAGHPRGGLMGAAGVLALYSHNTVTSPTLRGKFVVTNLLCFDVPPPPAGVVAELPEGDGSPETMREKVERHRSDPTCNGCHQFMDPIGLALENFDAIGAYRTTEQGLPIDASGELAGAKFNGAAELARTLRESPDFAACVARRLYRYGTGHLELRSETPAVNELIGRLSEGGGRLQSLALALVTSAGFRLVGAEPPAAMAGMEAQ
jgi:hypothetical protein